MRLRYNYRIYPTADQTAMFARTFGCARVVYNDALTLRKNARQQGMPYIRDAEMQRLILTVAKKTPERSWLSEVSSVVLQQSVQDLNTAYRNFFDSVTGRRRGPRVGLPVYKTRHDRRQSARFNRNAFRITHDRQLYLAKIGSVEVRWSRDLPTPPTSVTIVRDAAKRYFASFVVEIGDDSQKLPKVDGETGIDLGLTHYATLSDGSKISNPRWLRRRERKLARLQRDLSRKQKGSANREKARDKVARQHVKVADARRDFLHRTTTTILRENQAVYVEDLAVRGLARGRASKSVRDASWGMFLTLLSGKAGRFGRQFAKIDRWYPSSHVCPCCDWRANRLPLSQREWDCLQCGEHHDRDVAAALNVLAAGIADRM